MRSAQAIVPRVLELVPVKSIVDVGCGIGTWLSVYESLGVPEIMGLDGDYVDRASLMIDPSCFHAHDLSTPYTTDQRYDLVQSLEVAEHIPPRHAGQFVHNLTELGDIILFSAAVPFQLGTGHVNEQHLDYWTARFSQHGFVPVDALRPDIWDDESIELCYRQNIILLVKESVLEQMPRIAQARRTTREHQLAVIHPDLYQARIGRLQQSLLTIASTVRGNGNIPLAREILQSVVDFDPRNDAAWNLLGQTVAQAGQVNPAISHLRRALEINPEDASHHFILGQIFAQTGDIQHAEQHLEAALRANPGDIKIKAALEKLRARKSRGS